MHNSGIAVFHGPVAGGDMVVASRAGTHRPAAATADVGVLTVLDYEIRAVTGVLRGMRDFRERRLAYGPLAREAWLPAVGGGRVRVAAVQTLRPGTEGAALSYRGLVDEYNPSTVLLVGIAGAIGERARVGDVVVAEEVIAYDARRETSDGPRRRGRAQSVAAAVGHRLNDFFAAVPAGQYRAAGDSFTIRRGPIGSGNAVVTDEGSEIRGWLHDFHERVLAVETEAAGVAAAFHENVRQDGPRGWLAVRGLSDRADAAKGKGDHDLAAGHAAEVMAMLLPYLGFDGP